MDEAGRVHNQSFDWRSGRWPRSVVDPTVDCMEAAAKLERNARLGTFLRKRRSYADVEAALQDRSRALEHIGSPRADTNGTRFGSAHHCFPDEHDVFESGLFARVSV